MKFEKSTIDILNNFATINQSIVFKAGNVLATVSQSKTIVARANIANLDIPEEFGIYNLPQFLSVLSLFEEPEIAVNGKVLEVKSNNENVNYVLSEPRLISQPPADAIKLPTEDVVFTLAADVLKKTLKALNVIQAPSLAFSGIDGRLYVEAIDTKNSSSNAYKVHIGETDKTFRAIFAAENLKIIPQDYEVSICSKGISYFKGDIVSYWLAVEKTSKFD